MRPITADPNSAPPAGAAGREEGRDREGVEEHLKSSHHLLGILLASQGPLEHLKDLEAKCVMSVARLKSAQVDKGDGGKAGTLLLEAQGPAKVLARLLARWLLSYQR